MSIEDIEITAEIDSVLAEIITGIDNPEKAIETLCKCRIVITELRRLLTHAEGMIIELRDKESKSRNKIKAINNVLDN